MGKVNSHNTRKVYEKINIPNLLISQIFWVKQKSIQFPKHGKMVHSTAKVWENTNISNLWVS